MAALEYRVLTGLLREQSFKPALRIGLKPDHFKDPEARMIYEYLRDHWHSKDTINTLPPVDVVQRRWPSFEPTAHNQNEEGPLLALMKELKSLAFESEVRALAAHFQDLVEADPVEAIKTIKASVNDISYKLHAGSSMGIGDIAEVAKNHYRGAKTGLIYGIPWPWECLTEDTLGKRPGNFVVFYGRPKSMKTWVLTYCAAEDYLTYNKRVMIWSGELSEEQLALRVASILARVDYQLFKKGKLPPRLEQRAFETLEALAASRHKSEVERKVDADRGVREICIMAGPSAPKTVEELSGAVAEFQPDSLYLDAYYKLDTGRTRSNKRWERVACLTEDVKSLAMSYQIPVVAAAQANRAGEKGMGQDLTEVADTDVIGREADLIARVIIRKGRGLHEDDYEGPDANKPTEPDPSSRYKRQIGKSKAAVPSKATDDDRAPRVGAELAIVLSGNREGVLEAFTIHAVPGYNFRVINTKFSSEEVKSWVAEDEKADRQDSEKKPSGPTAATFRGLSARNVAAGDKPKPRFVPNKAT